MIDAVAFYGEVGRRIRLERERRVWTQDMLSAKVSLTRSSISNIEAGRQKFLLHDLAEIAFAFGVPLSQLLPSTLHAVSAKSLKGVSREERDWIESPISSVPESEP